jgi:hypothetical protein
MKKGQTVLESFIAPLTAEQFFAEYWPERVYASHGGLERNLGIPPETARIGVFASPPGDGASCHYDTEDVISIQLTGSKAFHVAPVGEVPYPLGMRYSPGSAPDADLYPQVAGRFPEWLAARTAPFGIDDLQQQFPQFPDDQHLAMLHAAASAELIRMLWYPLLDS